MILVHRKSGRESYYKHREKKLAYGRQYYKDNKDKALSYAVDYFKDPEKKEKRRLYMKNYYKRKKASKK